MSAGSTTSENKMTLIDCMGLFIVCLLGCVVGLGALLLERRLRSTV